MIIRTINAIARGFVGDGMTKSASKKPLQAVQSLSSEKMKKIHRPSSTFKIIFSSSDLERVVLGHDDLMVISTVIVNAEVKRVFIDQASSADIIFRDAFGKLGLKNSDLQMYKEEFIGVLRRKGAPRWICHTPLNYGYPTSNLDSQSRFSSG